MSDMRFMNREMKKRQLRENIVPLPRQDRPYEEEDDAEARPRPTLRRRILTVLAVVLVVAVIGFGFYRYQSEYGFTDYDVLWEKSMRFDDSAEGAQQDASRAVSESSFVNYAYFGENMLKYTKDGATYIDADGKNIWTQSYEMKTPIVSINGECAAIADQQGNQIYICNTAGCTGVAKTQLPITKVAVSARGVAAAVVEDSTASYIFYYKKDGEALGINIKMLLSGDGYPLDIALSPDGQQIAMSVSCLEGGILKNKVVFYDFSEIGKNVENRFVGAFEDQFDGAMPARVRYLNADTVAVFADTGISFISVRNVIPDTNVISVPVEDTIEGICYSDKYAGVIVDNTSGNPNRIDIYTTDGKQAASFDFDYPYKGAEIDGERVILYNDDSCQVYNMRGRKKFEGRFGFAVSCVRGGGHLNSLIVTGSEKMQEIQLK